MVRTSSVRGVVGLHSFRLSPSVSEGPLDGNRLLLEERVPLQEKDPVGFLTETRPYSSEAGDDGCPLWRRLVRSPYHYRSVGSERETGQDGRGEGESHN